MESTNMPSAWTQIAEIELVYRPLIAAAQRPKINSAQQTYELLLSIWNPNLIAIQEEIKALFLNQSSVLGVYHHSKGTIGGVSVDRRLILGAALKAGATHIILAHNHPSGNLVASAADKRVTAEFAQAAELLDITLLDHLIISTEGYCSFAEKGNL